MQVLAGVLLRSATVFLALCNDTPVLGPWVNGAKTNAFTATVIAILIPLSVILTASVMFPSVSARQIVAITIGCAAAADVTGGYVYAAAAAGVMPSWGRDLHAHAEGLVAAVDAGPDAGFASHARAADPARMGR